MINRMRYLTTCSLPLFLISAFTVCAPSLASSVQAVSPKLEQLTPLPLHDGLNVSRDQLAHFPCSRHGATMGMHGATTCIF